MADAEVDPLEFDKLAHFDTRHWWYLALQRLVLLLARPWLGRPHARILDAGCGAGGMLAHFPGRAAIGMDASMHALSHASRRLDCPLCQGSTERLPFADETFDLVLSMDVLYHANVKDDVAALRELRRVLKPGGGLVLNLPAYEALRSSHDAAIHTQRRYTRRELSEKVRAAGLHVRRMTHWNFVLFPLIALTRWRRKRQRQGESDLRPTPSAVNTALAAVMALERCALRWANAPFGLSILCVAEKT